VPKCLVRIVLSPKCPNFSWIRRRSVLKHFGNTSALSATVLLLITIAPLVCMLLKQRFSEKKTIFAYCLFISVFGDSVGNVDTSSISSSVASHVSTGQQEYYKIIPCIGLYIRYYIHLPACTSDLCRPTDLVRNSRSDQGSSFEYRRARQLASR